MDAPPAGFLQERHQRLRVLGTEQGPAGEEVAVAVLLRRGEGGLHRGGKAGPVSLPVGQQRLPDPGQGEAVRIAGRGELLLGFPQVPRRLGAPEGSGGGAQAEERVAVEPLVAGRAGDPGRLQAVMLRLRPVAGPVAVEQGEAGQRLCLAAGDV
ncbi:hypothetical protein DDT91_20915, partial [Algoriphagus sp. AK58]|nr:hypothetical protein [Algoriphagus sp. AK58]